MINEPIQMLKRRSWSLRGYICLTREWTRSITQINSRNNMRLKIKREDQNKRGRKRKSERIVSAKPPVKKRFQPTRRATRVRDYTICGRQVVDTSPVVPEAVPYTGELMSALTTAVCRVSGHVQGSYDIAWDQRVEEGDTSGTSVHAREQSMRLDWQSMNWERWQMAKSNSL